MTPNLRTIIIRFVCFSLTFFYFCCKEPSKSEKPGRNFARMGMPRGLLNKTPEATPGYVLFNPLLSAETYLINMDGQVVKMWESEFGPSAYVYLKENGVLARGGRDPETPVFDGGGQGGWLQEFDWDGNLVWEFKFSSSEYLTHHDVAIMPNGNYLAIAWESKTPEEAIAAGRDPQQIPKAGLWPDWVVELQPIGNDSATIVWEWHIWDHMIQDFDESKANYGVISQHPELLDLNLGHIPDEVSKEEIEKRKARNNANTNDTPENQGSDMYHFNAIHYNPALDQIILSSPALDEILIIDHSTTVEEAASHEGGRWGKGGDLLYRWGNPENYDMGDSTNRKLGGQHDVKWIDEGLPGAGNIMVFNNQVPYGQPGYSSVLELVAPLGNDGYYFNSSGTYGPETLTWSYISKDTVSFFSPFISGAHRMSNGNTFVTEGASGRFFEVNNTMDVLWEYMTPYAGYSRMPDGTFPQPVENFVFATFRAIHIPMDHTAIKGKMLEPLSPQPEPFELERD
jgi:hypothetical protein